MPTAISTASFLGTLGINTHIDFGAYGYENLGTVESAIRYLGLTNLRDSAQQPSDLTTWQQVAQATGAKFDDYVGETSPAGMQVDLGYMSQLAQQGILNYIEGGNEEDDAYPVSLGNNLQITAQFQQQIFALGHQLGLPVINMSFGAGWTAANNWAGNYGQVGDLSYIADYANAHTYPNLDQLVGDTINRLNGLAHMAASGRAVVTTEMGWDEGLGFGQDDIARYTLDAALDGIKYGNPTTYFYALFDDASGRFGLMNSNGSAKPAGEALHNLTTILQDSGGNAASFSPGALNYTLSNSQDDTVLMEKSDGSYWLSMWNEAAGAHAVTLTLDSAVSQISVYDPLSGTSAIQTANNTNIITLTVPDHPVIVQIGSGGFASPTPTPTPAPTPTPTPAPTPTPTPTPAPTTVGNGSSGSPEVTLPGAQTATIGQATAISGASISDALAATTPGLLALNVLASGGTVAMQDANGNLVGGSGSGAIHVAGTLSQINAELATLTYTAAAADGSVTVDVWDQHGAEATRTIRVTGPAAGGGSSGSTTTSDPAASGPAASDSAQHITIAPDDHDPVEIVSNAQIFAQSGDHMIFIGGTGNTLNATGGTETVQAYQGGNTINTGDGDDTLRLSGSGNVVNAGGGYNMILDSGTNTTIVLPSASQGYDDIYSYMLSNGTTFDLRSALAGTSWNGDLATIGNFVKTGMAGNAAVISIDPNGSGGSGVAVATLNSSGPVSLDLLLAHSIT